MPLLSRSILLSEDVVSIARELIGKEIVTSIEGIHCRARITETEAYRAPEDRASHAYGNRRTARTETMFAEPGTAYIYLCYGIHHLFNVVTGPGGTAHAVLIRAVEPIDNIEAMLARRNFSKSVPALTAGPGRWTLAMGITTALNGIHLLHEESPVQLFTGRGLLSGEEIRTSPRIGVDYAGESAAWPWRFFIHQSPWVSRHQ